MSAEPDKPLTPVSRGERLAAAVLAAIMPVQMASLAIDIHGLVKGLVDSLGDLNAAAHYLIAHPTAGGSALLSSSKILTGMLSGLWMAAILGAAMLLPWAIARASLRFRWGGCSLWWIGLGHGALVHSAIPIWSRYYSTAMSGAPLEWYRGWFDASLIPLGSAPRNAAAPLFLAEMLLAAAVLWFTRRRKGEAQTRPADAQG